MRVGFYSKLAVDGIRKNKKLYLPYMLTSILMIVIFYIIFYLSQSESLRHMRGGATFQPILAMGIVIIGFFASIFLFYTNSFLIKRRKKEFGLYNILGMDKHGISKVLLWETFVVYVITIVVGLALGVLLSKAFELGFVNIINGVVDFDYSISWPGVMITAGLFGAIDVLIFLNGVRQIRFSNIVDLVKSANVGEKAPKGNWLFGIVGFGLLATAYYMAASIENPVEAFTYFFTAVIMVIAATYLLMIAGSVVFCKILQKNKNYYYKKSHFVSISSMVYRMKRNGGGLASICILLTMILVTISSTTCLFFGNESSLKSRFPREIIASSTFNSAEDMSAFEEDNYIRTNIQAIAKEAGTDSLDVWDFKEASLAGYLHDGNCVNIFPEFDGNIDFSAMLYIHFMELGDYNAFTGKNLTLNPGEAYAWRVRGKNNISELTFDETGDTITIIEYVEPATKDMNAMVDVVSDITLVVNDFSNSIGNLARCRMEDEKGRVQDAIDFKWIYGFNTSLEPEQQVALKNKIYDYMHEECYKDECLVESFYIEALEAERLDFFTTFAGFLFLGLMLSAIFLVGAILIMYYKQITEGYEDQPRFIIMQKVGMTKKDIKKSINSQMLTVFFLPLGFATLHMAFAFPMVTKLLLLFGLADTGLFIITTALTILVIAFIYVIAYKVTSNIYYGLVSSADVD